MLNFFSRRKKWIDRPPSVIPSSHRQENPNFQSESPLESSSTSPEVQRKIHPDLNSLAEELSISVEFSNIPSTSGSNTPNVSQQSPGGLVSLPPSTRRTRQVRNTRIHAVSSTERSIRHSNRTADSSVSRNANDSPAPENDIHSVQVSPSPQQSLSRSVREIHSSMQPFNSPKVSPFKFGEEWATFGRKAPQQMPDIAALNTIMQESPGQSSSSSQPHSRRASRSRRASTDTQPRTPTSHLFHHSTPHSNSLQDHDVSRSNLAPSPHNTFGVPTPPTAFKFVSGSTFFRAEEAPPLPPLDHPAFHISSGTFGRATRIPRHAHSLPSMSRSRRNNGYDTIRSANSTGRKKYRDELNFMSRSRSKPQAMDIFPLPTQKTQSRISKHSRTQSKSSITSSRRSSAEYSSRKVSSIGHGSEYEQTWEVQVSKEMVRMAMGHEESQQSLKTDITDHDVTSLFGSNEARGKNVGKQFVEGTQSLGSPFLFQDTHTYYPSNPSPEEYTASLTRRSKITRKNTGQAAPHESDTMMKDDTTPAHNTLPRGKGKSKEMYDPESIDRRGKMSAPAATGRSRTPPPPELNPIPDFGPVLGSSSFLAPSLSVTAPTPEPSPISPKRTHYKSTPTEPTSSRSLNSPPVQKSHSSGSTGKRKADEAEVEGSGTPPKEHREPRATFALDPRPHRASANSGSSHAPSSFHRNKRARLSTMPEMPSRSGSKTSIQPSGDSPPNAKNTGSWSSRGSAHPSRAPSTTYTTTMQQPHRPPSRGSLSQNSMPLSALISPHAPSIARSTTFHMRDPRKPAPIQNTPWTLSFPSSVERGQRWSWRGWIERGGSPLHAWLFFIGFAFFPVWWAAAVVIGIPRTRRLGGNEAEKGVVLDDPQVEHDAKSWRFRCRIMAFVSLFTYIPFIVLVAVFTTR